MQIKHVSPALCVADQVLPGDVVELKSLGFRTVINNRPDGEAADQPDSAAIAAAVAAAGLEYIHIPVVGGKIGDTDVASFAHACDTLPGPALAFCRSGTRSIQMWARSQAGHLSADAIINAAADAGYDLDGMRHQLAHAPSPLPAVAADSEATGRGQKRYDVVIVGGGSAGIATAASLLHRAPDLDIAIIEPNRHHYYQPGFTLAGGGIFEKKDLVRSTQSVMPSAVSWIQAAVGEFLPERHEVVLTDGTRVNYRKLVVAPGIKLDWTQIEGLTDTLGRNGVTSNYRCDLTDYTWRLVQELRTGRALFTQPPMPIKCAGAPQKAMYLSCDHWKTAGRLKDIDVGFYNAGGVLFGIDAYVPALMEYVRAYDANLNFFHNLVAIDGDSKTAWFDVTEAGKPARREAVEFDMIHVCPPQVAPDVIRDSLLADDAGWVDVDPDTLRHSVYEDIFGLGDACSAPNAKTMAAARKQAPVVAENVIESLHGRAPIARYDGYGSCPLTVERGKVVLAEFGYGGKLLPSFPKWLVDGQKPSRIAWYLKERLLPPIYYKLMLRGHEWLARPGRVS